MEKSRFENHKVLTPTPWPKDFKPAISSPMDEQGLVVVDRRVN